jgi:stage II sporulation protein D
VPSGTSTFDVINDVDVDDYLKGVLARELRRGWDEEAYRAQAIVARTYALYEARVAGPGRYWDLYPDQRSQVYGGLAAETSKSRDAVDDTRGIVVAYGPPGQEKIFKAYFSSCCGGITQSAADAFGDAYIQPLSDRNVYSLCNASPRFNWGPIVIRKDELTRRFRAWGTKKARAEQTMALVARVDIQAVNRWGRPTRFLVTDARGASYSWTGEELRWAVNTDAPAGSTLNSSFCKIINTQDAVHFVEGHGWGHGVGMCQWCAQRLAEDGMRCEDIVLASFQKAVLVRAY